MRSRIVAVIASALVLTSCTGSDSPTSDAALADPPADSPADLLDGTPAAAPVLPAIGNPGDSFTTEGWTLTHVGDVGGRSQVRRWLRDVGVELESSSIARDWDGLRLDRVGERLFLSGRTQESAPQDSLVIVELDPTSLEPSPVAVVSDPGQFTMVQGIHDIDGRVVAHVGGGDKHGSLVLRSAAVTTRLRPLVDTDAMVTTPTRTDDGWVAGAMIAGTLPDGTPSTFPTEVAILTSADGRSFEVAAQLDQPAARPSLIRAFAVQDAVFDSDGSGLLVGSYVEQVTDVFDLDSVPLRVPLVVEVARDGTLTPIFNRRQDELGALTQVAGTPDDPSFTGFQHSNPDDRFDIEQVEWRRRGRSFAPEALVEARSCDGADSWTREAAAGGLVVGSRSRGGGTSEPVVVVTAGSSTTCILPRAFGAMSRTWRLESVVELAGDELLAVTSDHELWHVAPATGPDTPPTTTGSVEPSGDWERIDPPTRAYARRVLVHIYRKIIDLRVEARAARADGVTQDERGRVEAQVAAVWVPELVEDRLLSFLDDASDNLRRSPGAVELSNVSVGASTPHCIEVSATVDFGPAINSDEGNEPRQHHFALVRHDASQENLTGWALTSTLNGQC